MYVRGWTLRPIAPKIATSPLPLSLPANWPRLSHSIPASANNFLEDPRPTPLLPALQLASFPPSPATDRHHSLNPDFLNYPKPLFIFSRSYLFALFPSCFTYYHVHTLFPSLFAESTPFRSSRLPVLPSFFHHLAEEGKDHWAPVGSCVCCKVPTTSTRPFTTRWRAVT